MSSMLDIELNATSTQGQCCNRQDRYLEPWPKGRWIRELGSRKSGGVSSRLSEEHCMLFDSYRCLEVLLKKFNGHCKK